MQPSDGPESTAPRRQQNGRSEELQLDLGEVEAAPLEGG
jgi:hypothetical protein